MRYLSLFKLGYTLETGRLPQQQPRRSWMKPLVGAAAGAGLAYMGDRYLNNGAGMNWMKQQFNGNQQQAQPAPKPVTPADPTNYQQVGQDLSDLNDGIRDLGRQVGEDGHLTGSAQMGQAAGSGVQLAPTAWKYLSAAKPAANAAQGAAQAGATATTASKLGLMSTAGTLGKVVPVAGGLFGALNDDIAERGFANVNLGEPTNRTLGGLAGAVTSLHPVGIAGNLIGNGAIGAYNWHTGNQAEANAHAGATGDVALNLLKNLKIDPDQTLPYARGFLRSPVVEKMMNNPAERHPTTNQLLQRLLAATQQVQR